MRAPDPEEACRELTGRDGAESDVY
jgi:hypothetical protein